MPQSNTIQNILEQLDTIIEECIATNNRMGLFAYIYRRTTAEIASEIELGNFEDNQRLEKLDVAFAKLYLDAYTKYKNGQSVRKVWDFAFDSSESSLTIIQHIMLGMNAHINLDLSIATARTMAGQDIKAIEADFDKVNDILFQIVNEMQERLSRVSPLMFILDLLGKNKDEKVIDFSMRKARQQAWNSANLLWSLGEDLDEEAIDKIDRFVLVLSHRIKTPKAGLIRFALKILGWFETKKVSTIISKLKEDE